MSEEIRKEYYTYDMARESTLFQHEPPSFDLTGFNKQLVELAGKDPYGDPRIRIAWSDSLSKVKYYEDANGVFQKYKGKKYPFMRVRRISGYSFYDKKGVKTTVTSVDKIPKDRPFVVEHTMGDLGVMKYVVEMKYTLDELIKLGYYPEDRKEREKWGVSNGQRYADVPDARGDYMVCFYIETPDGGYRDVVQADLEAIKEIWYRAHNESDREYVERKQAEVEKILNLAEEQELAEFNDALDKAIVRAEKSVRGQIYFDQGK